MSYERARIAALLADRMEDAGCRTYGELCERVAAAITFKVRGRGGPAMAVNPDLQDLAHEAIVHRLAEETGTPVATVRGALEAAAGGHDAD